MEKNLKSPIVVWLRVTDYMHGWIQSDMVGEVRVGEQRVVCLQHLPGVREVMKMRTAPDESSRNKIPNAMSAMRHNCLSAAIEMDADWVKKEYGVTADQLELYVPVECPDMCVNSEGVMRPWLPDVSFSHAQASELQRVLRSAFWQAVARFNHQYARQMNGKRYAAVDMIEAWCTHTHTPDTYVDAMRREWQRRVKRGETVVSKSQDAAETPPTQINKYL